MTSDFLKNHFYNMDLNRSLNVKETVICVSLGRSQKYVFVTRVEKENCWVRSATDQEQQSCDRPLNQSCELFGSGPYFYRSYD